MAQLVVLKAEGLQKFSRDLKRLDPAVQKAMASDLRGAGEVVRSEAASIAPRRSGRLAASIKLSVTQAKVSIYSTLPYAPVVHWGGTITPRGSRIVFTRTEFISKPAERHADELAEKIGDSVERAARATGWK
jgi:phage gpG-like protein